MYIVAARDRNPGRRLASTTEPHQDADRSQAEEHPSAGIDIKGNWIAAKGNQCV